ncbi:MAG: YkvA family protein [Pirellulales bacterium]
MSHESNDRLHEYSRQASTEHVERIESNLDGMNRGPISKLWIDVKAMWAMIKDPTVGWGSKAIAVGALLYLVSPLDAIPDLVPFVGLTDDAGVILAAVSSLCHELARYRRR